MLLSAQVKKIVKTHCSISNRLKISILCYDLTNPMKIHQIKARHYIIRPGVPQQPQDQQTQRPAVPASNADVLAELISFD